MKGQEATSTQSFNHYVIDYAEWLRGEFAQRVKRNSHYTLRSFAQLLRLDSSTVSQVMQSKRRLSPKMVEKLATILGIEEGLKVGLMSFAKLHSRKSKKVSWAPGKDTTYIQLPALRGNALNHWHHFAILELTFLENFSATQAWVAKKLGISRAQAQLALEQLKQQGLLVKKSSKWKKSTAATTNYSLGETSDAHRELQREVVQKALESIDCVHPEEKDITHITMAIDESKLDEARKYIQEFRRGLCQFLERGNPTRVYNLSIQLYPVSKS